MVNSDCSENGLTNRMIFYILFASYLSITTEGGQARLNTKGPTVKSWAASCIAEIGETEFFPRGYLGILSANEITRTTSQMQDIIFMKMHAQQLWQVEVFGNLSQRRISGRTIRTALYQSKKLHYILIADSIDHFNELFEYLLHTPSYNAGAQFVIFMNNADVLAYKQALELLWKHYALNTILLAPTKKDLSVFRIYRLEPFNKAKQCGTVTTLVAMQSCRNGRLNYRWSNLLDLRKRLPKDLDGCIINTIAKTWIPYVMDVKSEIRRDRGVEARMLLNIGFALNISFNIIQRDEMWGDIYPNGTWSGLLEEIKYGDSNLGIGNVFPDDDIMDDFTLSIPYFFEHINWFVPKAELQPQWESLMQIFSQSLWLGTLMTFIVVVFFMNFWSKILKRDYPLHRIGECVMDGISLVFGLATVSHRPRTSIIRTMFLLGSLLGIHINALYSAGLIQIIEYPIGKYQIHTEQDLIDNNLDIYGVVDYKQFFEDAMDPEGIHFYRRYMSVEKNQTLPYYLAMLKRKGNDSRGVATPANRCFVDYLIAKKDPSVVGEDGKSVVYGFDSFIVFYTINMVAKEGFPLMPAFNRIIEVFVWNGILIKWYDEIRYLIIITQFGENTPDLKPFRWKDVEGPFCLMGFGYFLATVAIFLELMWKSWHRRRKNDQKLENIQGAHIFRVD